MLAGYRRALSLPGVARVVAAVLVCYLLAGMVNLSLLTSATQATGSYAIAGAVVAAYSTAVAVGAPVWGRAVDRRGPRRTLAAASTAQVAAFAGYLAVLVINAPAPALIALAAVAGSCSPPSSAVAKRVFATLDDADSRRALFAISGLFTELVFVVGPLIVGAVVAFGSPAVAVAVTGAVSLAGVWWLRGAAAVRALGVVDRTTESRRRGPLDRRQLHVLAVVVLGAVAIGALQVSVVAHAAQLGVNPGGFVAAMACGGVVASFAYGAVRLPGSLPTQLAAALGLYGAFILAIGPRPAALVTLVLLVLAGAATGPADAIEALLIAEHTPSHAQSQAFAALTTANWLGFAAGSALAGAAIDHGPLWSGTSVAATAALVAALSLVVPRWNRRLR